MSENFTNSSLRTCATTILVLICAFLAFYPSQMKSEYSSNSVIAESPSSSSIFSQVERFFQKIFLHFDHQNYDDPEIWTRLTHFLSQLDTSVRESIFQLLALLNAEPEWNNLLDHLAVHGFPELATIKKIDLLASLLHFLSLNSQPILEEKATLSNEENFDLEIKKMSDTLLRRLNIFEILNSLDTTTKFSQDLILYLKNPNLAAAFDRLRREPSFQKVVPWILDILGVLGPDKKSLEDKIGQILEEKLFGPGIHSIFSKNKDSMRLVWLYTPDSDKVVMIDTDATNPRADLYLMQSLKFYRDLKSSGYDHLVGEAERGGFFQTLEQVKTHDELSFIRKNLQNQTERAVPLPGNKPPRYLKQIQNQISALFEHKRLLDRMKEIAESPSSQMGPIDFGNFAAPYARFLYEAQALQTEIEVNGQKIEEDINQQLESIISDLVKDQGVLQDVSLLGLDLALIQLVDLDVEGFQDFWPRFADFLGKIVIFLKNQDCPVLPTFAALLNAEFAVDNMLTYLAHNGFPELVKFDKKFPHVWSNFLNSLLPLRVSENFEAASMTFDENFFIQEFSAAMNEFFYLVDTDKFLMNFFTLRNSNMAFHNLVRFLERLEFRTGYRRIVENLRHPKHNFIHNIIQHVFGMEKNPPTKLAAVLTTIETLLAWTKTPADDFRPIQSWSFDPQSGDLNLVPLDHDQGLEKMVQVYRSLFFKLGLDLKLVFDTKLDNDGAQGMPASNESIRGQFLQHVDELGEIGTLEKIVFHDTLLTKTTTTTEAPKVKDDKSEL